jgi:exopolysaccharide biosynthesis polyprenyl glycosylphosphotransferase
VSSTGIDEQLIWEEFVFQPGRSASTRSTTLSGRLEGALTAVEVLVDAICVALGVLGAFKVYDWLKLGKHLHYPYHTVVPAALAFSVFFVLMMDRDGAYRRGNSLLRIKETERALRVSIQCFLFVFPITFFAGHLFSRWVLALGIVCVPLLLIAQKQLLFAAVRALHAKGYGIRKVLIYGSGYTGKQLFSALVRSPKLGLQPVVFVDDDASLAGTRVFESGYKREQSALIVDGPLTSEIITQYDAQMVLIAIPSLVCDRFADVVKEAIRANVTVATVPGYASLSGFWTDYSDIDGVMLASLGRPLQWTPYEHAKQVFDFTLALAILVAASPVLLLIALLVRLDSPGPALFTQKRAGRDGQLFDLYKFRSMRTDAPAYARSPKETDDPRITRLGRLLRHTGFDELPQLLNVLKGEMSLVGPRPEMPCIVQLYNARHRKRLSVLPGITGLWQLSADRPFPIHENIQYDLYYIRNRSFFMDLAILLHTLVFGMRGI